MKETAPIISVAIIAMNEENRIGRAIESVKDLADEIVVIDACSEDRTREIAREMGAKVYEEEWKGFAAQRNSALEKCTGEWILFLDCDEVVTPELCESIKHAVNHGNADAYLFRRKTWYLGRFLEHAWQPDWKLRLVRRSAQPRWEGVDMPERLVFQGKARKISGLLYHYPFQDLAEHMDRTVKYARIAATAAHREGKRFNIFRLLFSPPVAFFKEFVLKRGFLDGLRGLLVAFSAAFYSFLTHAHLWDIQRKRRNTAL